MKRIAVLTLLFLASAAFSQSKPKADPAPVISADQKVTILDLEHKQDKLVIQSRAMQSQFETQMKAFQDQYNALQKQLDDETKNANVACGKGYHADMDALKCVADAPVKQEANPKPKN